MGMYQWNSSTQLALALEVQNCEASSYSSSPKKEGISHLRRAGACVQVLLFKLVINLVTDLPVSYPHLQSVRNIRHASPAAAGALAAPRAIRTC